MQLVLYALPYMRKAIDPYANGMINACMHGYKEIIQF